MGRGKSATAARHSHSGCVASRNSRVSRDVAGTSAAKPGSRSGNPSSITSAMRNGSRASSIRRSPRIA